MPIVHKQKSPFTNTNEVVADKHYFVDKDGNMTTDSTKAASWIVREGSPISKEDQEKYGIPEKSGKVAQPKEETEKSAAPKENKKVTPSKNKGVKEK